MIPFSLSPAFARCTLAVPCLALLLAPLPAAERGDFWLDATLFFRTGKNPQAPITRQPDPAVSSDTARVAAGDSSVAIDLGGIEGSVVLLLPGPYRDSWALGPGWTLHFEFSAAAPVPASACAVTLFDAAGRAARGRPAAELSRDAWTQMRLALAELARPADFDFSHVTRVALGFTGEPPRKVWLDAVRFVAGDAEIGLTDLLTTQRIADERATRPARIAEALRSMASTDPAESKQGLFYYSVPYRDTSEPNLQRLFANLCLNQHVTETNRELLAIYTTKDPKLRADYGLEYTWDLLATPMLGRFYFNFGHASKRMPGRITPELEQGILDLLWERTQYKNDIHLAQESTWYLTGSENHDINAKIGNVLSSQILMHETAFADRSYPDRGTGAGYGYWFHKTKQTGRFHGPEGRAVPGPPDHLAARKHYNAWVAFMKEYLRQRVARGFFLEKGSPTYAKYTMSFITDLYDYVEDPELKKLAGMFLDLAWAEWAQDELNGARGGAKTRDHGPLQDHRQDGMYEMATFEFGGPSRFNPALGSFWLSDFRPSREVWNIVLNRAALGCFAYVSRTPGEEQGLEPRPFGMERTLMCDTDSRLRRYSWVTPDYVLGTQMDDPRAVHSHLSPAGRAQGIIFSTSPTAMVFPRDVDVIPNGKWNMGSASMYRSVQEGPVLITQQSRQFTSVSPDWFPAVSSDTKPFGVYFSPGLNHVEEKDGWVFIQEGNAYLAVRIVSGVYQFSVDASSSSGDWLNYQGSAHPEEALAPKPYAWNSDHTILLCNDRHAPVIFEAGRRADYPTLAAFQSHILGNKIALTKIAVPGWYTLTYVSNGTECYFNAANSEVPRINGEPVNYAPARTFDSPWLSGDYHSEVVTMTDGHTRRILDFGRVEEIEEVRSPSR